MQCARIGDNVAWTGESFYADIRWENALVVHGVEMDSRVAGGNEYSILLK